MAGQRLGVGVVGAGRWAGLAHLPGWARDERCQIVGVCDLDLDRATAAEFAPVTRHINAVLLGEQEPGLLAVDTALPTAQALHELAASAQRQR